MFTLVLFFFAAASAQDWAPTLINITTSWPGNSDTSAGAVIQFDSPAGDISEGSGSCDITITTAGTSFVHFFDADILSHGAMGLWTICAMGSWQDLGTFNFLLLSDAEASFLKPEH